MKKGDLVVRLTFGRKHFYSLLALLVVALGAVLVTAFGGNNPAVLGHSAGELIVNDSSIPGQLSGSKISVATLSGSAPGLSVGSASSASTAGSTGFVTSAPGCGSNNFYNPDPGSCVSLLNSNNAITYNAPVNGHTFTGSFIDVQTGGGLRTGGTQRLDTSGNLVNIGAITATGLISTGGSLSASGTLTIGGNTVFRCTAGSYVGVLTTTGDTTCLGLGGASGTADTGLRVD